MTPDEVKARYAVKGDYAFDMWDMCDTCGRQWYTHLGLHCGAKNANGTLTKNGAIFSPAPTSAPSPTPYSHTTLAALAGRQQPTPAPAPPTVDISQWQAWRRKGEDNECPCGGVRGVCPFHP